MQYMARQVLVTLPKGDSVVEVSDVMGKIEWTIHTLIRIRELISVCVDFSMNPSVWQFWQGRFSIGARTPSTPEHYRLSVNATVIWVRTKYNDPLLSTWPGAEKPAATGPYVLK